MFGRKTDSLFRFYAKFYTIIEFYVVPHTKGGPYTGESEVKNMGLDCGTPHSTHPYFDLTPFRMGIPP